MIFGFFCGVFGVFLNKTLGELKGPFGVIVWCIFLGPQLKNAAFLWFWTWAQICLPDSISLYMVSLNMFQSHESSLHDWIYLQQKNSGATFCMLAKSFCIPGTPRPTSFEWIGPSVMSNHFIPFVRITVHHPLDNQPTNQPTIYSNGWGPIRFRPVSWLNWLTSSIQDTNRVCYISPFSGFGVQVSTSPFLRDFKWC